MLTRNVMQREVKGVRPEMSLADLDRWLLENRVSGAPVLDRDGRTIGVISRSDIARQVAVGLTLYEITTDYYGEYSLRGPVAGSNAEMHHAAQRLRDYRVRDAMSARVISVRPDTPIQQTARVLVENGIHRVLVQDEDGKLVGIVAALDIVRTVAEGRWLSG